MFAIDLADSPTLLLTCIRDWLARDSALPEDPHSYRKPLVSICSKLWRETKEKKPIWLTTLLISISEIPPSLLESLCLPHTVLGHVHKWKFSIPEISLSAAGSSPLSASRDDAANSSSVRVVTLWVTAHINELGTDIGSEAEQFCMQYSSLIITGLSSFKFKTISSTLQTNCAPLYLCFQFIFLLLFATLQNCKITSSCFLVFDSIQSVRLPFNPSFTSQHWKYPIIYS